MLTKIYGSHCCQWNSEQCFRNQSPIYIHKLVPLIQLMYASSFEPTIIFSPDESLLNKLEIYMLRWRIMNHFTSLENFLSSKKMFIYFSQGHILIHRWIYCSLPDAITLKPGDTWLQGILIEMILGLLDQKRSISDYLTEHLQHTLLSPTLFYIHMFRQCGLGRFPQKYTPE